MDLAFPDYTVRCSSGDAVTVRLRVDDAALARVMSTNRNSSNNAAAPSALAVLLRAALHLRRTVGLLFCAAAMFGATSHSHRRRGGGGGAGAQAPSNCNVQVELVALGGDSETIVKRSPDDSGHKDGTVEVVVQVDLASWMSFYPSLAAAAQKRCEGDDGDADSDDVSRSSSLSFSSFVTEIMFIIGTNNNARVVASSPCLLSALLRHAVRTSAILSRPIVRLGSFFAECGTFAARGGGGGDDDDDGAFAGGVRSVAACLLVALAGDGALLAEITTEQFASDAPAATTPSTRQQQQQQRATAVSTMAPTLLADHFTRERDALNVEAAATLYDAHDRAWRESCEDLIGGVPSSSSPQNTQQLPSSSPATHISDALRGGGYGASAHGDCLRRRSAALFVWSSLRRLSRPAPSSWLSLDAASNTAVLADDLWNLLVVASHVHEDGAAPPQQQPQHATTTIKTRRHLATRWHEQCLRMDRAAFLTWSEPVPAAPLVRASASATRVRGRGEGVAGDDGAATTATTDPAGSMWWLHRDVVAWSVSVDMRRAATQADAAADDVYDDDGDVRDTSADNSASAFIGAHTLIIADDPATGERLDATSSGTNSAAGRRRVAAAATSALAIMEATIECCRVPDPYGRRSELEQQYFAGAGASSGRRGSVSGGGGGGSASPYTIPAYVLQCAVLGSGAGDGRAGEAIAVGVYSVLLSSGGAPCVLDATIVSASRRGCARPVAVVMLPFAGGGGGEARATWRRGRTKAGINNVTAARDGDGDGDGGADGSAASFARARAALGQLPFSTLVHVIPDPCCTLPRVAFVRALDASHNHQQPQPQQQQEAEIEEATAVVLRYVAAQLRTRTATGRSERGVESEGALARAIARHLRRDVERSARFASTAKGKTSASSSSSSSPMSTWSGFCEHVDSSALVALVDAEGNERSAWRDRFLAWGADRVRFVLRRALAHHCSRPGSIRLVPSNTVTNAVGAVEPAGAGADQPQEQHPQQPWRDIRLRARSRPVVDAADLAAIGAAAQGTDVVVTDAAATDPDTSAAVALLRDWMQLIDE